MKIVIDNKIPFIEGVLEPFGTVEYLNPSQINKESVSDANALVIRTRTKCDAKLLDGSPVEMIATATIGFDHIDRDYCANNNIEWKNAPGCNAPSVGQYVGCALMLWAMEHHTTLEGKTLGIVGLGNTGSQVEKMCSKLGMNILRCDPPKAEAGNLDGFCSLNEIAENADFVTFHTPITKDGEHPTYHLANEAFFSALKKKPVIVNAARGGVVDESAMKQAFNNGLIADMIIDCWENEPNIDLELMQQCYITTPHIAGYSADGKSNATRMAVQNLANHFNITPDLSTIVAPRPNNETIDAALFQEPHPEYLLTQIMLKSYDPRNDSQWLSNSPGDFEQQRGDYPLRREFLAHTVVNAPEGIKQKLQDIGFNIA